MKKMYRIERYIPANLIFQFLLVRCASQEPDANVIIKQDYKVI